MLTEEAWDGIDRKGKTFYLGSSEGLPGIKSLT
jgi:hypothetical protein